MRPIEKVFNPTLEEIVPRQKNVGIVVGQAISEHSAQYLRSRKTGSSRCRGAYVDCQQYQGSPRYRWGYYIIILWWMCWRRQNWCSSGYWICLYISLWLETGQQYLNPYNGSLVSASGASVEVIGTNMLDVEIADITLKTKVLVVKNLAYACIVGIEFFQEPNLTLIFHPCQSKLVRILDS